jgi:flagellar motility protein MotE (MotC chaperone)
MRSSGASRRLGPLIFATLLAWAASAQDGRAHPPQKPRTVNEKTVKEKASGEKASGEKTTGEKIVAAESPATEASRYCVNVAPSVAEARIAWQIRRLSDLDAQVKQRIADLEKAEASARQWVDKREALLSAASDQLTAIYAKMEPESAARQISDMDDRMAAAILGKLKPRVASAILNEMEAERASKLAAMLAGAEPREKKS